MAFEQVAGGADPAAPVVDDSATAGQPGADPIATSDEQIGFEDQMKSWLDHGFNETEVTGGAPVEGDDTKSTPSTPAVPVTPAPTPAPVPANAAQPAASGDTTGGTAPAVAPDAAAKAAEDAMMVALLGVTDAPPAAAPQVQPAPAPAPGPSATAETAQPALYTPLPASIEVPDSLCAALFESEDPASRKAALGNVLASFGNAILALADKRMAEHHVPAAVSSVATQQEIARTRTALDQDFYGAFPDLKPHRQLVVKAFKTMEQMNPNLQYNEQTRAQAGNLVRRALQQLGIQTAPAAAPAPAPAPTGVRPTPARTVGFEAGGARPAASLAGTGNTPADLVAELNGQF